MGGQRLTLLRGEWYGWTMWPGYGDTPYHSPIRVEHIRTYQDGSRHFDLHFLNAGYANGVQMMVYELRTLIRREHYLLADVPKTERSVALVPLTLGWCRNHLRTHMSGSDEQ
jgi:hypothetical protein